MDYWFLLQFVACVIGVEAITQIITKSEIFSPVREFFYNRRKNKVFNWLHDLLDCGYCTSVWIGWLVAALWVFAGNLVIDILFVGIVLHRLSNIFHFIIDRLDRTRELPIELINRQGEDDE